MESEDAPPQDTFSHIPLGDRVDLIYEVRARAALKRKELQDIEQTLVLMERSIRSSLADLPEGAQFYRGEKGTVGLQWKAKAVVEALKLLQAHIAATGEFDLLQNRLSETACRERWEVGNAVPGVIQVQHQVVTYSKLNVKKEKP